MTRVLLACLLCAGCAKPPLPIVLPVSHHDLTRVILSNDLPGNAELCVQLLDNAAFDAPNVTGSRVACWGTVGDLRRAMTQQQRAD